MTKIIRLDRYTYKYINISKLFLLNITCGIHSFLLYLDLIKYLVILMICKTKCSDFISMLINYSFATSVMSSINK